MINKCISIAGFSSLLGQGLIQDLLLDPEITISSVHDAPTDENRTLLEKIVRNSKAMLSPDGNSSIPLLGATEPAHAPVLLSFLPDATGERVESAHLQRGTLIISHCEYAREIASLTMPGITPFDKTARHIATPNCTTAMCSVPIHALHQAFGVTSATITTLQAISGTDLPGMHASAIHDQVVGHLGSEADALTNELRILFRDAFPIDTFATRVPVWRGHTITLALGLRDRPDLDAINSTLTEADNINFLDPAQARDHFPSDDTAATVVTTRRSQNGVLLTIKGDNLGFATVGIMHALAKMA